MLQLQGGEPIVVCAIWYENLWSCSTLEVLASSTPHKLSTHFLGEFDWSKVFNGSKHGIFM
jgi:hypothetical protein